MDTLSSLWLVVDSQDGHKERVESIFGLADYYEECGYEGAAELLRHSEPSSSVPSTKELLRLCESRSIFEIIRKMDRRQARLFACACVEQAMPDDDMLQLTALRLTREHEFGLASEEALSKIQDDTVDAWRDMKQQWRHKTQSKPNWTIVRACGAMSRPGEGEVTTEEGALQVAHVDAMYASHNSRAKRLRPNSGWTPSEQIHAAAQHYLLGRLIAESKMMRDILAKYHRVH